MIMASAEFVKELMDNADFKKMLKSMHDDTTNMIKDLLDSHTKRIEEMERKHPGGPLEWQAGYQARPCTHKKHPNHVFFQVPK